MKIQTITPGILTIAIYVGFPPIVYNDVDKTIIGTDIQYLQKFAKQNDLKIVYYISEEFDKIWELPGKDVCDISASGIDFETIRQEESPGTSWSNPYYNVQRSFITQNNSILTGPFDLSGKTIIVTKDSTAEQDLQEQVRIFNIQNVTIQYSNSEEEAAQLIYNGKAFASGAGLITNIYLTKLYRNLKVSWIHDMLSPSGEKENEIFSFPTRTKSTGLIESLNNFIANNKYNEVVIKNVYIALITSNSNLLNYNEVISLFNYTYPMNSLIIETYFIDGSINEINRSLDNFINKYPSGKRATISTTTATIIECSNYFIKHGLDILSLSLTATSNILQKENNILTYASFNKYAVINNFLIYNDYQMKNIHVLYQQNTINDLFLNDYLEQIKIQANLLNIPLEVSFLQVEDTNYNIRESSMVIILANTASLQNIYITPSFIKNFPKNSFIILTDYNTTITNIFSNIPTFVQTSTNINFTTLSETIYNAIKNKGILKSSSYPFYDILFVLNDFTTNGLEITKENYVSINPYGSSEPAWLLNTSISPIINSAPYGKYQYTFTKDVIIGNNKDLFLKYYNGGQQQLPNSYSIFKIAGITPNNPSLIEYDESEYYEIYNNNNQLVCVKFNSDVTNFPIGKNLNVGKTIPTKFIYKYNDDGYFIKLERLYPNNGIIPKVNSTMSKVPIKLKYII